MASVTEESRTLLPEILRNVAKDKFVLKFVTKTGAQAERPGLYENKESKTDSKSCPFSRTPSSNYLTL